MPHDPIFEKVLLSESSFVIKEEHFTQFEIPWHVHPEFELTFISQGKGKINVGDYISDFRGQKLIMLGPNLPHSWYGPKEPDAETLAKQIVIQFPFDFLGAGFFDHYAFRRIGDLLKRSYRGIMFHDAELQKVKTMIQGFMQMNEFERIMEFLNVLHTLAERRQYNELSSIGYSRHLNKSESARLNAIYGFILDHFKTRLDLNTVASFASMTPQAFSRYFRERTRRTFVSFLNEVRIGHACKLLSEKSMSISQICYESGYSNLSNFNRQFKVMKSMTPTQYARGFE
jgi:AraC-like DNA-binding protein